uniref:Uncharacterized protein n=1 Tax=Amphimedon queenslandica TaxID=400682 RepID=A0A1X7TTS9_AMPQE
MKPQPKVTLARSAGKIELLEELKETLPDYIVECFKVTGFDNITAITQMKLEGENNSINVIEKYIDKRKKFLQRCMGPEMYDPDLPFEFPPVHDLKRKYGRKLEFTTKPCKRRKIEPDNTSSSSTDVATDESTDITENDIPAVKSDIRKKVHKWIKGYNNGQLCSLKENIDYTIIVTISPSDPACYSVSIRCGCNKAYVLSRKTTGTKQWQINNWSRHCIQCRTKKDKPEQSLHTFFTNSTNNNQVTQSRIPVSYQISANSPVHAHAHDTYMPFDNSQLSSSPLSSLSNSYQNTPLPSPSLSDPSLQKTLPYPSQALPLPNYSIHNKPAFSFPSSLQEITPFSSSLIEDTPPLPLSLTTNTPLTPPFPDKNTPLPPLLTANTPLTPPIPKKNTPLSPSFTTNTSLTANTPLTPPFPQKNTPLSPPLTADTPLTPLTLPLQSHSNIQLNDTNLHFH